MTQPSGPRTSGMIALVPRQDARTAMAVDGGDPPDDLHLTLAFLGPDVTAMDPTAVRRIAATIARREPVMATIAGRGVLGDDGAAVYLLNGADLGSIRDAAVYGVARHLGGDAPEQHEPPIAHVTAGYGIDAAALTHTGPVVFDAVRLALGDQIEDFPMDLDPDAEAPVPGIDPDEDAAAWGERKDVVATAAGEERYGKGIGEEIGEARDGAAQEARNDEDSMDLYREFVGDDPKTMAKGLDNLGDDELQRLTRVAYSGKTSDPKIVALRLAVASEMASRDMNVTDYGARGGGLGPGKGKRPIPGTGGTRGGSRGDMPAGWQETLDAEAAKPRKASKTKTTKGKGKSKGKGKADPADSPEAARGAQVGAALYARQGKAIMTGVRVDDAAAWDEGVALGLAGLGSLEAKESGTWKPGQSKPSANPGATRLREHWVHGPGAAKIAWGTPGDFKRCVGQLREHVGAKAEGLCNVYHRAATGAAPGKKSALAGEPEFSTLFVADGRGSASMRLVRMLGGSASNGRPAFDREAKALSTIALRELDDIVVDPRYDDAIEAAERDRKALARALDPTPTPWQAHAVATGDAYVAGMLLGVYGRARGDRVAAEAKAAGVPVVETKDVSTASGGTTTGPAFGSVQRGDPNAEQADRLRSHFTTDPRGLAKWRPEEPGRYKRLVRSLRKVAGSGAEGLGAVYYRDVMGEWPGRRAKRRAAAAGTKGLGPVDWDAFAAPEVGGYDTVMLTADDLDGLAEVLGTKALPPALAKANAARKRKPGAAGDPEDEQGPKRDTGEEPAGAGAPAAARRGPARPPQAGGPARTAKPPQRADGAAPPGRQVGAPGAPDPRADDRTPPAGRPAPRDTPPGGANKPGDEVVIDPETGEEVEPAGAQDAPGGGEPQRRPGTASREAEPVGDTGAETDRDGEEIAPEVAAYPEVDTDVDMDEDYEDALANTVDFMITPEGLIVPDVNDEDPVDRNAQGEPIDEEGNVIDEPEDGEEQGEFGEDVEDGEETPDDEGDPEGLQPPEDEMDEDPEAPDDDDSLEPPDGVDEQDPEELDESDPDAYPDPDAQGDDEDEPEEEEPRRKGRPAPGKPGVPATPGKARKPGAAVNAPPFGKGRSRR